MNPISLAPVRAARVILKRIQMHRLSRLSDIAILTVDSVEALEKLRKWEQGDKALYSSASIEARYKNRTNKEVYHWLDVWWDSAFERSGSHSGSERPTAMSKQVYVNIYVRVSQAIFERPRTSLDTLMRAISCSTSSSVCGITSGVIRSMGLRTLAISCCSVPGNSLKQRSSFTESY